MDSRDELGYRGSVFDPVRRFRFCLLLIHIRGKNWGGTEKKFFKVKRKVDQKFLHDVMVDLRRNS